MRIAFYAPLKPPDHLVPSGDRTMARALMAALRRAGHEVEVACRFRSYDPGDPARQARLRRLGERLAGRLVRRLKRGREKPDLWLTYHLYHKAPDWLGPEVARRLGIPYVVAEASHAPKQAGGRWDSGHRAVAEALRAANLVLLLNPADAACVLPLLASPDRLLPLPPFLDAAPFRAAVRDRAALTRRYDLETREPWLLTAAMMRGDQKLLSYFCLADALSRLADAPWRLLVAGNGPAEAEVRAAFAPVAPRVRWLGALDGEALRHVYAACDLYVWPAIKEAWGMTLVEAQAAGLAVVAGRSGGVASVVADGETGLLVTPGDAGAFAGAVRRLLADPDLRRMMGSAAMARAAREHDIGAAADRLDRHLAALARPR